MKKMKRAQLRLISTVLAVIMCLACFVFEGTVNVSAAANVELTFNGASAMSYFSNANNLQVSYSDAEGAVQMAVTGSDPYVLLKVEDMATVSADVYKYVVVTYRVPTTNSSSAQKTELFMCAGSVVAPAQDYSVTFVPTKSYKYRSEVVDMTSKSYWSGQVHSIRIDAFNAGTAWDAFYLASITFCSDSASASSAAASKASEANGALDVYSEATLASASYELGAYTKRYWEGDIVFNEAYYPLCNADGTISPASLMYDIKRVISVRSGSLGTEYKYGVDWTVTADGKFQVIPTGSIPKVAYSTMYNPPANQSHPTKSGGSIFAAEGATFHNAQLAITYTHDDSWDGFAPDSKVDLLPGTYSKLQNKQHITAVFYGDSITYGCNASGLNRPDTEQKVVINVSPYSPIWSDMTVAGLKAKYGYNDISYVNTAVGGTLSTWGVTEAATRVAQYNPDLVFIGFGMNDGAGSSPTTPAQFKANIQSIINTTRNVNPNAEFVLVSSIVANPETTYDGIQEQYLPVLEALEAENTGVALADVMSSHKALLQIKKYSDMTGNNVNHPNDFIVRQYAQTMLTTLSPSNIAETRDSAVNSLNNYVSLSDYRAEEQSEIESIIASGTQNINAAETVADVRAALAAAKALIDDVKTAAEYEAENLDYTYLRFNSAAALTTFDRINNITATVNSGAGVTTLASTGSDPYVSINYDPGNVSASTYKYITIVYNVPSTVANTSATQVFLKAGSNTSYTEANSVQFTLEKGGYAFKVIDLSSASYWNGKIHGIRFDTFSNYQAGDAVSLHSIRLFESATEASSFGSRTAGILSGNYTGMTESVQFDTESELSRITSIGGERRVGDVDGSGAINSSDLSKLKKILACTPGITFDRDLADANRDGKINSKDSMLLKKYLAGIITLPTISSPTASISYSSQYKCAYLEAPSAPGTVVIDLSDKALSADDMKFVSLVAMNRGPSALPVTVSLMRNGAEVANTSVQFTLSASDRYTSNLLDFSARAGWSGAIDGIKVSFDGTSLCLGGIIVSDVESGASSKGATKALSLNRMIGVYTPVTGQTVVPLNGTTTMATFANYNSASNGSYTYPSSLSFDIDRQPDEKFDRITLRYTASAMTRGVISYRINGASVSDEFFLEASGAEASFSTLIPGYFSGSLASELISVTLYPINTSSVTFSLKGIYTEDMANYNGEIYMQNSQIKVGVLLTMGGGISHYEKLDDGDARYSNLLNRYDVGRLIQQSYYGINTSPYVMGDMGGTPWRYNPVQGGDVHNNASQIVDLQVTPTMIYVKTRPMDWGHNNHKTPSYMENWYTIYDSFTKVDNRFVDFSTYTHTSASQELPAFYTVSALGTFCMYTGSSPWSGGAYSAYSNLGFWAGNSSQNYAAATEGWYAWIDGTGFGVGIYVPNCSRVLAGRYYAGNSSYVASYSPDENPTNYFAPLRTMTLKQGKALTYSYLICAGQINNIRTTFQNNRGLINNSALSSY